jgi:hypothetical protein
MLTVNETKTIREIANYFRCIATIERAMSYSAKFDNGAIWNVPVSLNYQLKNTAGNANRWRIHLHPGLLHASEEEQLATFLHETAHVMDCIQNGASSHGYGWQEQMIRLAQNPLLQKFHNITSCKKRAAKPNPFDDIQI